MMYSATTCSMVLATLSASQWCRSYSFNTSREQLVCAIGAINLISESVVGVEAIAHFGADV